MSKQIHPFTTKLVRQLEVIDSLYLDHDYSQAWRLMLIILRTLKPDTKKDKNHGDLVEELDYALEVYRRTPGGSFIEEAEAKAEAAVVLDKDFLGRFSSILWLGKYLDPSGAFFDPSLGRKST